MNQEPAVPVKSTAPVPTTYTEWCQLHACDHGHCPVGCEHPQPFVIDDGRLVCGRCAIMYHVLSEMVPCYPEVCD